MNGWALVEAGFQREYGIDLARQLPTMSWRRFQVLLRGLQALGNLPTAPLEGEAGLAVFDSL